VPKVGFFVIQEHQQPVAWSQKIETYISLLFRMLFHCKGSVEGESGELGVLLWGWFIRCTPRCTSFVIVGMLDHVGGDAVI
jgi:hypothetical protein